jgi:hypothetical protein
VGAEMILERQLDATRLNQIVNDPSVYDHVRGAFTGTIDLEPFVADHNNVLLMGEHGGMLFIEHQKGLYECHTQILPDGRGPWALDLVSSCLYWMFVKTPAVEIATRIPKGNIGARSLAIASHFTMHYRLIRGWQNNDGKIVPADIFSIDVKYWMRDAPYLEGRGRLFHDQLIDEYEKLGVDLPQHLDDPAHDRYAGAAFEMIRNGQPGKGVALYNRWATVAGYQTITQVTNDDKHPVAIDIRDAVLSFRDDGTFEVVSTCPADYLSAVQH